MTLQRVNRVGERLRSEPFLCNDLAMSLPLRRVTGSVDTPARDPPPKVKRDRGHRPFSFRAHAMDEAKGPRDWH